MRIARVMPLAWLVACSGEPVPPPLSWHGEHLSVGQSVSDSACAGTFQYLDEFTGALKARLGGPSDFHAEYYWVSEEELGDYCTDLSPEAVGCTDQDGTIFAIYPAEMHELVHSVRSVHGFSHGFLEEGVATVWSGVNSGLEIEDRGDIEMIIRNVGERTRLEGEYYPLAAHFVGYLLSEFGDDPFITIGENTSYISEYGELEVAFQSAYNISLKEVLGDYASYPECAANESGEHIRECWNPALALPCGGSSALMEVDLSCASDDTFGPVGNTIATRVPIEILEPGLYMVHAAGDPEVSARLRRCSSGCTEEIVIQVTDSIASPIYHELDVGVHVLTLTRALDSDSNELEIYCQRM